MENSTTYNIVSNADTIILLTNPCIKFAEWPQSMPLDIAETEKAPRDLLVWGSSKKRYNKKSKKRQTPRSATVVSQESVMNDGEIASIETSPANRNETGSAAHSVEEISKELEQCSFGAGPSAIKRTVAMTETIEPGESIDSNNVSNAVTTATLEDGVVPKVMVEPKIEEGIRFQVCAGNLMSASPWFNRVLRKDGWMESRLDPVDRWFHISAQDWDEEAFLILMNVFHLRNHEVPRTLTLEMLAKFAVLTDYYECGESVDLIVGLWVADLRAKTAIPTRYCRDLILSIWISWTFKLSDVFKKVTAVAITQSDEPIPDLGLPIPAWITDEIDARRCWIMETIVSELNKQLDVYRSCTYTCPMGSAYSFRCGSMLLGALMKQMNSLDLMSQRLESPCLGQTFNALCAKASSIESETWFHGGYAAHSCLLSTAVGSIVDLAVARVAGLDLRESSAFWKTSFGRQNKDYGVQKTA